MKEFEITCPLTREPRLKEIEAKASGMSAETVLEDVLAHTAPPAVRG